MIGLAILSVIVLLILMAVGAPVAFALLLTSTLGIYLIGGMPMVEGILISNFQSATTSYELVTVPMFLLMAEFIIISGIADKLFRSAAIWAGRLPGGLGIATAMAGAGLGAISGSSTASAATLASTSYPAMIRENYRSSTAAGVVAISGTLAMLIPPSIALILYAYVADISVGKLLVAGIIPGLLVAIVIALTVSVVVIAEGGTNRSVRQYSWREKIDSLKSVVPVIGLFGVVMGLIYSGLATPTEAAGIGAFGAMALTIFQRKLTIDLFIRAVIRATGTTCMIFIIIVGAKTFGYFFTLTQVTPLLMNWVQSFDVSRYVILLVIILIYIVLGCFLDLLAILLITVPLLLPIVIGLEFDPYWFGVLVIIVAEIGLLTPPLGINVYVVSRYTGASLGSVFKGVIPHIIAHFLVILLLIIFPGLVLWLPSTLD